MSHHENRQTQLLAQPQQQTEDLPAHRRIQAGNGLISDEYAGLQCKRSRDDDPLALTTGKFMRVAQEEAFGWPQTRLGERLGHLGLLITGDLVDAQAFGDGVIDGVARIEGAERVLQDQLHLATEVLQPSIVQRFALKQHRAPGRLFQPEQSPRERCLAAAGFPDECDDFTGVHLNVNTIDGPHATPEDDRQVARADHRLTTGHRLTRRHGTTGYRLTRRHGITFRHAAARPGPALRSSTVVVAHSGMTS